MKREDIVEIAGDDDILFADGFDNAIIGVAERAGMLPVVAYDSNKCIQILVEHDNLSQEEAEDFFDFNVIGSYVGERTPIFITSYGNIFSDDTTA